MVNQRRCSVNQLTLGCPASSGMSVRFAPESVSGFARNRCPLCSGTGVRLRPEYAFLKGKTIVEPEMLAQHLRLERESTIFILNKLVREGRVDVQVKGR